MASDNQFNLKSCTTGHTGFGVPHAMNPDTGDIPRSAARPLRYMDRYVTCLLYTSTGFTEKQNRKIEEASKMIPVLKAANTSFMVNVLMRILEFAADNLADSCDIEVMDIHDRNKLDAPSGTALELSLIHI